MAILGADGNSVTHVMPISGGRLGITKAFSLALAIALCASVGGTPCAMAQGREASEFQVKAAFLYNFVKFVEWPSEATQGADAPITICIVGQDPFGSFLDDAIENKSVNGHKLAARRLKLGQNVRGCQVAFIGASEKSHVQSLLESLKASSVLTVGDTAGFAELGGVINFTMQESRVRFEINVNAAERAGLKISSKLLNLATIVKDQEHGRKD
jgi:hypothetical protein